MQKYSVNQQLIETVLASVKAGEIAIPEIQRPFVWDSSNDYDIKQISDRPFEDVMKEREEAELSGAYWNVSFYVYMQSEINIKIGNRPPKEYFGLIQSHIQNANPQISGISTETKLLENLRMNCVPTEILDMELKDYQEFLAMRRKLMAEKIKGYYFTL
ncbi:MAG: hypothetical protein LBS42_06185 [Tannerella sp.]|jgi:hypothetical protein|nr:hypothetical protein [Tannerella sp.]